MCRLADRCVGSSLASPAGSRPRDAVCVAPAARWWDAEGTVSGLRPSASRGPYGGETRRCRGRRGCASEAGSRAPWPDAGDWAERYACSSLLHCCGDTEHRASTHMEPGGRSVVAPHRTQSEAQERGGPGHAKTPAMTTALRYGVVTGVVKRTPVQPLGAASTSDTVSGFALLLSTALYTACG